MNFLKDKKGFVTGGSSGIGKAIVQLFLEQGADVAFFGTDRERGEKALHELRNFKSSEEQKLFFFPLDVSNSSQVDPIFTQASDALGGVDFLVNNAGITRDALLMKMKEEDWDRVLEVNLKSLFLTCKWVTRPMLKQRSGVIVNISSVVGLTGNAGQVNYAASKAGAIGFTKSLAKELATRGVRAHCVAPGYVETKMTDALPPSVKEEILKKIPLGRIGDPLDIARVVLFLVSDWSLYMTGQTLAVDGGMVM